MRALIFNTIELLPRRERWRDGCFELRGSHAGECLVRSQSLPRIQNRVQFFFVVFWGTCHWSETFLARLNARLRKKGVGVPVRANRYLWQREALKKRNVGSAVSRARELR